MLALLLAVGAAGYAYWTGAIGNRPSSIAQEVTEEVRKAGLDDVKVALDKTWIATVTGSVVGQDQKQTVESVLKKRSEIQGVNLDGLTVQPSSAEILAAAQQTLAENGLGHITVAVDDNGVVGLGGRALNEREADIAGEAVSNIDGVTQVDNQIRMPFAVLERAINSALRASGLGSVRAIVRSMEDISVAGTLKNEADRAKVVATIVQAAATDQETVDPSAVRDDMTVAAPIPVVAAAPRAERPSKTVQSGESTAQPSPPAAPVEPESPLIGTWAGAIRAGIVGSNVQLDISSASIGAVAGRTDYYGSYRYCAGELTLVNATPPKYVFEEKIIEKNPKATCPGGGKLTMEIAGPSTASVNWVPTGRLIPLKYSGTVQRR